MSGFCGIKYLSDKDYSFYNKDLFKKSINLVNTMKLDYQSSENSFVCASKLNNSPNKGKRVLTKNDLTLTFSGDLIEYDEIPWNDIVKAFEEKKIEYFAKLRGFFALCIYNETTKKVSLISDHRSQQPLFYTIIDDNFIFSTSLSTFTTLKKAPVFDIKWFYEVLFFNFPLLGTTFLNDVKKMPPASILTYDLNSKKLKIEQYKSQFSVSENLLKGDQAYKKGVETFKEIIPKYYSNNNLVALTGGFDSRSLLSLAPKNIYVTAYTYGIKNTGDLKVSSKIAKDLKLNHKKIFFDKTFENNITNTIYESVRLSGGYNTILRSTLPYVYKTLYKLYGNNASIVMGGIGGDLFRGDGSTTRTNGSTIASKGICSYVRGSTIDINQKEIKSILKNDSKAYKAYIENKLSKINELYGEPSNPEFFMLYDVYNIDTSYFGGEVSIASNYFTVRQPYLDSDIINFAFKSEIGNLGLSPYNNDKKYLSYKKYVFQSKLIHSNPNFKNTYIKGVPVSLYAKNNKNFYEVSRPFIRGLDKIFNKQTPPAKLEDWNYWFSTLLKKEFDILLNENSLISEFVNINYIKEIKKSKDLLMISKLATTEIILNLIKNKWNIK